MSTAAAVGALAGLTAALLTAGNGYASGSSHPLSKRELNQALLTLRDLPAGYSKTPGPNSSDTGSDSCPQADKVFNKETAAEADAAFQRSALGTILFETIAQQRPGTAPLTMTQARRVLLKTCSSFTFKDKDGTTVSGRFQPEAFPRLGDETIAVSITLHSKGSRLNLAVRGDYVAVRTGDVITAVGQFGLAQTPSMTTFERLTRRAVAKVRRAQR